MSVTPMKMLTLTGPVEQYDDVIHAAVLNRPFHPEYATSVLSQGELYTFDTQNQFAELLRMANSLAADAGIALDFAPFEQKRLTVDSARDYLEAFSARLSSLRDERKQLLGLIAANDSVISQLKHVVGFPDRLDKFYHLNYVKFRFGHMPKAAYNAFEPTADSVDGLFMQVTAVEKDDVYLIYMTPRATCRQIDAMFDSMRFERLRLPDTAVDTPEDSIDSIQKLIDDSQARIKAIDVELDGVKTADGPEFLSVYSFVRYHNESFELRKYGAYTGDNYFVLAGWAPASEVDTLKKVLSQFEQVNCIARDPEDVTTAKPPVLLKNNLIGRIFQPFVEMYGLPAYNEIDPSFLMGVTYTILFGIMYGDVGQGVLLIIFGSLLYKLKGLYLGRILACVGVAATAFGFVYGSVFGDEELIHGFNVLASGENTTRILVIAVIIGISIIAFMMILNIVNGIRQRNWKKVFFEHNGVAGLVFYLSAIAAGACTLLTDINLLVPGYILPLLVLPLLIIFCREPLGKLVAHDPDWKPESISGFIMENFFELFEVLLSYVTNTVSFLRVGAYAISHAGMMMVVYMLGATDTGHNLVVIIIGNIVVMGIEGMLVCIQVLRLEFYEMFGRFYESGGSEYKPRIIDYKAKTEQ